MTTPTVKQIVDEYKNRHKNSKIDAITFRYEEDGRIEQHSEISNLYRDGVHVTELSRDSDYHEYQLDREFGSILGNRSSKWIRYVFRGKIIRFSNVIEE